jgi:hypothetical protein
MGTGAGNGVGGPANVGAPQGANAAVPHATNGGTCVTALFAACAAPTGKPSRGMRRRLVRGLRRSYMGTGAGNGVGGPANVGAPQGANAAAPQGANAAAPDATSGGEGVTALFAACAAPTGKPSRGMRRRLVRGLRRSCMGTGAGNGVSGPANVGAPQGANAAAPHATNGGTCVTALFAAYAAPTGKPSRGMRRRRLVRGLRRSCMGTGAGNGVGGPANVGAPQGANAAAPHATSGGTYVTALFAACAAPTGKPSRGMQSQCRSAARRECGGAARDRRR